MRITFTGDILCYQSQDRHCMKPDGTFDYAPVFERAKSLFGKSDYVVGSFETTCAGKEAGYTHADTSFNTPDTFLAALKEAGFCLLTTANNHCLDRGEAGLLRTIQKIKEYGLEYTGTRMASSDPEYLLKDFGGTKIAFISYTYGTNSASNGHIIPDGKEYLVNLTRPQDSPVHRPFWKRLVLALMPDFIRPKRKSGIVGDCVSAVEVTSGRNNSYEEAMLNTIRKAKRNADLVLFSLHSGGQFNSTVGSYTQHLFEIIADAGADAIICNHAHKILPIYKRKNCIIASALGNYSFVPGEGYWIDGVHADYSALLHLDIRDRMIKGYQVDICRAGINQDGLGVTYGVASEEEIPPMVKSMYSE